MINTKPQGEGGKADDEFADTNISAIGNSAIVRTECHWLLALIVPVYIVCYSLAAIWLLFDGWISDFSSISGAWFLEDGQQFPVIIVSLLYTILGAVLGGALLGITSFHRYQAIYKNFDKDHLWGFILAPLLAVIVAILIFAILQSGLVIFSGKLVDTKDSITSSLGYVAIGGITLYNWDVFLKKMEDLSKSVLNSDQKGKNGEKDTQG